MVEINPNEIQEALNNNTYDEVKDLFNLSSRALNKIISENNLEVKYKRRTRYTHILIPIDSPYAKYTGKKLEKFNKFQEDNTPDTWYSNQIEIYENMQKENELALGSKLFHIQRLQEEINNLTNKIEISKHSLEVLRQASDTHDYMGFSEEEALYKPKERPINDYISDDVFIGYVTSKYGLNTAKAIIKTLKKARNN